MSLHSTALKINPADESIVLGPITIRFLNTGADSNGSVAMFEMSVPAGVGLPAPTHYHDAYEETVYGLEGVLTWTVDGHPIELSKGESLCVRRGMVHRFDNFGSDDAKVLCVVTPAIVGPEYFRETAEVLNAAAGGPPDKQKMGEIMLRHGLIPVQPKT
jgi:quercetin dioxygenase-like cupin family protein